jgi:hypothetical protein
MDIDGDVHSAVDNPLLHDAIRHTNQCRAQIATSAAMSRH